jgi:nitroreductase
MELTQVMRTAGSTRRFKPDPVLDDMVYRVLDDARFAPSGNNRQGRRVAAIVPPELAAEIEIEAAEDEADVAARAALEEGGEPIPWEQVKAELDL